MAIQILTHNNINTYVGLRVESSNAGHGLPSITETHSYMEFEIDVKLYPPLITEIKHCKHSDYLVYKSLFKFLCKIFYWQRINIC